MYYYEACDAEITRQEAIREIKKHGLDPTEFFTDVGDKEEYIGQEILDWLGY